MIRLKQLISIDEAIRSKLIRKDTANKFIQKYCTTSLHKHTQGINIYRGRGPSTDSLIINPKQSERKSRNTNNIYTSLIDSSTNWKDYPRRSRSIIATINILAADAYGQTYSVFPVNGSKIGICSNNDFWLSFKYIKNRFGIRSMGDFNEKLDEFFNRLKLTIEEGTGKYIRDNISSTSPDNINTILDKYQSALTDNVFEIMVSDYNNSVLDKQLVKYLDSGGKFREFFDEILDPVKNEFELTTIENFTLDDKYDREVWTDAISVMVAYKE
jgi:hypothetical protein